MASNKKGAQTKEYIYNVSKALFYTLGYDKTTISAISKKAEVPIGLIPYHFKNKDNILKAIYRDFLIQIDECITTRVIPYFYIDNSILYHAILSRIYYQILFENDSNRRVYYDVLKKKSNYRILHDSIEVRYKEYLTDFAIDMDSRQLEGFLFCDFGARREFFLHYLAGDITMSIQDTVTIVNGIIPRLVGIDQNTVTEILNKSLEIFNAIDYADITFL